MTFWLLLFIGISGFVLGPSEGVNFWLQMPGKKVKLYVELWSNQAVGFILPGTEIPAVNKSRRTTTAQLAEIALLSRVLKRHKLGEIAD